jgi:hypothetical protein
MDFNNLSALERLKYYRTNGFTTDALSDIDYRVRIAAYYNLGYTTDALTDDSAIIRWNASVYFNDFNLEDTSLYYLQNYYRMVGYSKDQVNSPIDWVRHEASQIYGYTEAGLTDTYLPIRLECYRIFGFLESAFANPDAGIRHEAYTNLGYPAASLLEPSPIVREYAVAEYIKNNPV